VLASYKPLAGGPVAQVLADRRPVILEDASQNQALGEALPGAAVSSIVAVPLLLKARAIGVLTVGTLFPRAFSEPDASLLQLAADRAALAIERNRLYQREHDTAQQLTKALLLDDDKMPRVGGLRIAKRYLPGGADVGGDWYDALALPGGRLGLVMGDVAGRGVHAAASMGQLRSALRAYALEGAGPAEVLQRLNRFQFQLDEDAMATVVMVVLDPANNRLTWANAGHPPPLVLEPAGPRYLEHRAGGVPLGAIEEPRYVDAEAELLPGSTVILYTDGLVEHPGRPLAEGFDRLLAAIEHCTLEPEGLCDAILDGTLGNATSPDDVTFIVASAPAELGGRLSLSLPGEMEGLASLRSMVRRWLAENAAEPDEVAAVTMATNEAVENAIEHGHRLSPEPFQVELEVVDGEVVVTVKDRGRWLNNRAGAGKRRNVKRLDPSERGRGIKLMEAFMDDVDVLKGAAGTTVVLRRRLRKARPDAQAVEVASTS
jgi:serine phosphatase RsbU (regulator of sigma subunit)/anti-sigma regulatory factor (Ser/Thr protein kinase)